MHKLFEAMEIEFENIMDNVEFENIENIEDMIDVEFENIRCAGDMSQYEIDRVEKFVLATEICTLNAHTKHCVIHNYYTSGANHSMHDSYN